MIVKALLAWAGLRAAPHLHDDRVHDALNDDTAMISGFRCVARQALAVSRGMIVDPGDTERIDAGVDRLRRLMTEVARRAER